MRIMSLLLGELATLRKATISFVKSVRQSVWNNSALTERIFIKFEFYFRKYVEKIKVSLNLTRITGTLHEDQCTFFINRAHFFLE